MKLDLDTTIHISDFLNFHDILSFSIISKENYNTQPVLDRHS